jgi:hypothetical protein
MLVSPHASCIDNTMQLGQRSRKQSREGNPIAIIGLCKVRSVQMVSSCATVPIATAATGKATFNCESAMLTALVNTLHLNQSQNDHVAGADPALRSDDDVNFITALLVFM